MFPSPSSARSRLSSPIRAASSSPRTSWRRPSTGEPGWLAAGENTPTPARRSSAPANAGKRAACGEPGCTTTMAGGDSTSAAVGAWAGCGVAGGAAGVAGVAGVVAVAEAEAGAGVLSEVYALVSPSVRAIT